MGPLDASMGHAHSDLLDHSVWRDGAGLLPRGATDCVRFGSPVAGERKINLIAICT